MTRLARWTFGGTAAISSLLLLGTMFLWARSRYVQYSLLCRRFEASHGALVDRRLALLFCPSGPRLTSFAVHTPGIGTDQYIHKLRAARASDGVRDFEVLSSPAGVYTDLMTLHAGFGIMNQTITFTGLPAVGIGRSIEVGIPYWFIAVLAAIVPVVWWRSPARRYRWKKGHCQRCGYDLRGTPERCPECGTIVMNRDPR